MPVAHKHSTCDYCGLAFHGNGFASDSGGRFCCYGCYLVQKIIGRHDDPEDADQSRGGNVAAWIILRLGIGAFLSMNVMMISLILYTSSSRELGQSTISGMRWALLLLSTPAVLILASPFVLSGVRSALSGRFGTDALIMTGSLAAYGVSAGHVITGQGQVYFDTATMLLVLVTLGRLLEASAKHRAAAAIKSAVDLIPRTSRLLRDGRELEIPSEELQVGDEVLVKPGERIPADGLIVSGDCLLEESAFTGESVPRSCSPGDSVFGGSTNCDGLIVVRVRAVEADSMLAGIREMVYAAHRGSIPFQGIVDRATAVLTPVIWGTSLCAAGYWWFAHHDLQHAGLSALAVLVVACPCALGVAAPLASAVAISRAARAGVLARSGKTLERMAQVRKVFLDKSGTLTTGEFTIEDILAGRDTDPDKVLAWAASLEYGSEHVIGRSIVNAAMASGITLGRIDDFRAHPGHGVSGTVILGGTNKFVTVGSEELLGRAHIWPDELGSVRAGALASIPFPLEKDCTGWESLPNEFSKFQSASTHSSESMQTGCLPAGGNDPAPSPPPSRGGGIQARPETDARSRAFVGWDGHVQAVIMLNETLRSQGRELVQSLKDRHIESALISGDREAPASRLACTLGVETLFSGCTPEEKVAVIRAAREGSAAPVVAMVGDGINDAPALAEADVGIAVGSGTDLARQSSDVILLGDDLSRIPWLIDLSRLTCRIIRQNLWWAFGYNAIAVSLAFAGLLHPLMAALAMILSSASVLGNSMRLLRAKVTPEVSASVVGGIS
jgi:cation transport ATPase